MLDVDAAWLAGIIEGEGSFIVYENKNRNNRVANTTIRVGMTDEDVIQTILKKVEVGTIFTHLLPSGKTNWVWSTSRREDAVWLIPQLLPFLHGRRSSEAHKLLETANEGLEWLEWRKIHFICGHVKEGNSYSYRQACKICNNSRRRVKVDTI